MIHPDFASHAHGHVSVHFLLGCWYIPRYIRKTEASENPASSPSTRLCDHLLNHLCTVSGHFTVFKTVKFWPVQNRMSPPPAPDNLEVSTSKPNGFHTLRSDQTLESYHKFYPDQNMRFSAPSFLIPDKLGPMNCLLLKRHI